MMQPEFFKRQAGSETLKEETDREIPKEEMRPETPKKRMWVPTGQKAANRSSERVLPEQTRAKEPAEEARTRTPPYELDNYTEQVRAQSSIGHIKPDTPRRRHDHTHGFTEEPGQEAGTSMQPPKRSDVIPPIPSTAAAGHSSVGRWVVLGIVIVTIGAYLRMSNRSNQEQPTLSSIAAPQQPLRGADGRNIGLPAPHADLHSLVSNVARATEPSVRNLLAIARAGDRGATSTAALAAGRQFDFGSYKLRRDRKTARSLNAAALRAFYEERNLRKAYNLQKQAFAADPLDIEVAGNLAVFALRTDNKTDARDYVLYALGLPRPSTKTGRTADWSTLAAMYAADGDETNAENALFVTLGMASDIEKRCSAAVRSVIETYGPVLQRATEAMFERVREAQLSNSPECALPIEWRWRMSM